MDRRGENLIFENLADAEKSEAEELLRELIEDEALEFFGEGVEVEVTRIA